ncbi:Hint domain-containing protein [Roseomonas sp. CAU 1739]|uniref:Hint domain-containing protein n=1 Tax=Roseomonas sp. CAU 1739 TaxID=3140364 RepID=UPI00325B464D
MSGTSTVLGSGNDTFLGTPFGDTVYANEGDDTVAGDLGDDLIYGNDGNDVLIGSLGFDTMFGGPGADTIRGGVGDETMLGGTGADSIIGGDGFDQVVWRAGDGNDVIYGDNVGDVGSGNDTLRLEGWGAQTNFASLINGSVHGIWTVSDVVGGAEMTATLTNGTDIITIDQIDVLTGDLGVFATIDDNPPCFVAGTMIAAARGEAPVEALRAGDLVIDMHARTRIQPVIWVGHAEVDLRRQRDRRRSAPVRIAAGALGDGVPCRDLCVSPDHAVFLEGHLVPARSLVNGRSIVQELWRDRVTYYHVELAQHGLLVSDGAVTESYIDDGNRHLFGNFPVAAIAVDFAAFRTNGRYAARACAPILAEGTAILARIRAGIEALCEGHPREVRWRASHG